jgi:hypothetical protein
MAKIYTSGNYVIVEDGDNLYEYAKGHTLYLFTDDIFYIKEITQGQYKVSVADLDAGDITAEDSGDVYNVATFTTFLRENTGFKTAPGGSGAEWGSITGTLSTQSDLRSALDSKQDDLVSGTNIKTINGNSVLGGGDLIISGGLQGIHALVPLASGQSTTSSISGFALTNNLAGVANRIVTYPFIPNRTITSSSLYLNITTAVASSNARILIYSNLNGLPNTKLYESANLDCSTTGFKTATTTFTFTAGTTYWLAIHSSSTQTFSGISNSMSIPIYYSGTAYFNQYYISATFGSAPSTFGTGIGSQSNLPAVVITI